MRISDWSSDVCSSDLMSLAAHLAAKIAAMVEQAGRLQALTQSRASNQSEVTRLNRDLQAAARRLINEAELTQLKTRAADLDELQQQRSEEHTSELQSLMRISYTVFCLKKTQKKNNKLKL